MLKALSKLYKARIITPSGLYKLASSVFHSGVNLMALLHFSAKLYPESVALVDEHEEITYKDLLTQTEQLTMALQTIYHIVPSQKVAIMCRNHASLIRAIFSVSQCGADIFLLNVEMNSTQFNSLQTKHNFDLVIHDEEATTIIRQHAAKYKTIPAYHLKLPSIDSLAKTVTTPFPPITRSRSGNIIVLTGGTTGDFKIAARKPSVANFLPPFFALINKLDLTAFSTVYIATPVCHGFGLAAAFMSLTLGTKVFLQQKFDAPQAAALIRQHKIEVITVVPLMLSRLLKHDPSALGSLACIISGGAALSPDLADKTINTLGHKLFNLYGTSEAGFSILATPDHLRYSSKTAGKKITGVQLKILDTDNNEIQDNTIGRICIKSSWAMSNSGWIETGDLGYKDGNGYYFLHGRTDDMIVSGGENVYPIELENILLRHKEIRQVAVIGVEDEEFGQRLKAFVARTTGSTLGKNEILLWLSTQAARYQVPKHIEFIDDIPHTSLGKPDKKLLLK